MAYTLEVKSKRGRTVFAQVFETHEDCLKALRAFDLTKCRATLSSPLKGKDSDVSTDDIAEIRDEVIAALFDNWFEYYIFDGCSNETAKYLARNDAIAQFSTLNYAEMREILNLSDTRN